MKIAVCIKQVPTREWQPRLRDDTRWIREQEMAADRLRRTSTGSISLQSWRTANRSTSRAKENRSSRTTRPGFILKGNSPGY